MVLRAQAKAKTFIFRQVGGGERKHKPCAVNTHTVIAEHIANLLFTIFVNLDNLKWKIVGGGGLIQEKVLKLNSM
jgi:hypothetical protein